MAIACRVRIFTRSTWKAALFDLPYSDTEVQACIRLTDFIHAAGFTSAALSRFITLWSQLVPEFK